MPGGTSHPPSGTTMTLVSVDVEVVVLVKGLVVEVLLRVEEVDDAERAEEAGDIELVPLLDVVLWVTPTEEGREAVKVGMIGVMERE